MAEYRRTWNKSTEVIFITNKLYNSGDNINRRAGSTLRIPASAAPTREMVHEGRGYHDF